MATVLHAQIDSGLLHLTVKTNRLDAASARDFKKECAAFWQPSIQRITVDMESVEFLDSSGVGALLSIYKRLPAENPSVKLQRVQPAVQSVIELLRLNRIFQIDHECPV